MHEREQYRVKDPILFLDLPQTEIAPPKSLQLSYYETNFLEMEDSKK